MLLSLLIPTLESRYSLFDQLRRELSAQIHEGG
jgi:hypothetical protein